MAEPHPSAPAAFGNALALSRHFGRSRWIALPAIVLGAAAALAETLSVGLAVMLLFALLDQGQRIAAAGGPLAEIYARLAGILGNSPGTLALVFFALILCNAALTYANLALLGGLSNRVAERMRDLIHQRYVTTPYPVIQRREQGALMHTLGNESWAVSEAFVHLWRMGIDLCAVAVFAAGLLALSWQVTLVTLFGATVSALVLRAVARPVQRLSERMLEVNQRLAERMMISLTAMRTLRVFARETALLRRFGDDSAELRRVATKMETVRALSGPASQVLSVAVLIAIALSAGRFGIGLPVVIAAVMLLLRVQPYLLEFEANRLGFVGLAASLHDVRRTLETMSPTMPDAGAASIPPAAPDAIRFEEVSFWHGPGGVGVLDRVSFRLELGRTTLLAGPSGAGKTTVLNLLLRLYEPDGGRILFGDRDIASLPREAWLGRIAVAGQDVELIAGTVADNIRFGAPGATDAAVREVCAMVEILDDIEALPQGFDCPIGPAGSSFSGGQRQRLALARALIRAPEILILDEAMSAIEPEREDRIRARIQAKMAGGTLIVVSHRAGHHDWADAVVEIPPMPNAPAAAR